MKRSRIRNDNTRTTRRLSKSELDEMVEEALVDAYGESEQVRNLSPHAQKTYIEQVSRFAEILWKIPDGIGLR